MQNSEFSVSQTRVRNNYFQTTREKSVVPTEEATKSIVHKEPKLTSGKENTINNALNVTNGANAISRAVDTLDKSDLKNEKLAKANMKKNETSVIKNPKEPKNEMIALAAKANLREIELSHIALHSKKISNESKAQLHPRFAQSHEVITDGVRTLEPSKSGKIFSSELIKANNGEYLTNSGRLNLEQLKRNSAVTKTELRYAIKQIHVNLSTKDLHEPLPGWKKYELQNHKLPQITAFCDLIEKTRGLNLSTHEWKELATKEIIIPKTELYQLKIKDLEKQALPLNDQRTELLGEIKARKQIKPMTSEINAKIKKLEREKSDIAIVLTPIEREIAGLEKDLKLLEKDIFDLIESEDVNILIDKKIMVDIPSNLNPPPHNKDPSQLKSILKRPK